MRPFPSRIIVDEEIRKGCLREQIRKADREDNRRMAIAFLIVGGSWAIGLALIWFIHWSAR